MPAESPDSYSSSLSLSSSPEHTFFLGRVRNKQAFGSVLHSHSRAGGGDAECQSQALTFSRGRNLRLRRSLLVLSCVTMEEVDPGKGKLFL